jgi:hypothetical protein
VKPLACALVSLAALLLVARVPVSAAVVDGLYEAQVPVSGQDARERDRALRAALLQVAVRVSGQRRVPPTGVLSAALQNPARYVSEYGYGAGSDPRGSAGARALWARFDPASTNRLLREAGLPVWGQTRPSVLVWLAVERSGQRDLIGAADPSPLPAVVEARARARGVPLLLPTLDAQERVGAGEVWADAPERLVALSARYGADAVLLGRARERVPGLWETYWTLSASGRVERYGADGELVDRVVAEGLDKAVDVLSGLFAPALAGGEGPLPDLVVTGVNSFDDYARARRQLEATDVVTAVQPLRLDPGRVTFRISSYATREAVSQSLALGQALVPQGEGGEWVFQLAP